MNCTHKLIRRTGVQPPGSYSFDDPVTGMKFAGEGSITDVATKVAQHRLSNPTKFTSEQMQLENIVDEIDCWTCFRLGNDKRYCSDGKNGSPQIVFKAASQFCTECATQLNPVYCPTCSGRKIVSYKCPKCGKEFDK